jgi:hypothetical protein
MHSHLRDDDESVRRIALRGLADTRDDEIDRKLLCENLEGSKWEPGWDPRSPIAADRITEAAHWLKRPRQEIRQRYERLAEAFGLTLE